MGAGLFDECLDEFAAAFDCIEDFNCEGTIECANELETAVQCLPI